jgi:hypothetical protein
MHLSIIVVLSISMDNIVTYSNCLMYSACRFFREFYPKSSFIQGFNFTYIVKGYSGEIIRNLLLYFIHSIENIA